MSSLLDPIPKIFQGKSLAKLRSMKLEEKCAIFLALTEYPTTTWFYHNVFGVGKERELPFEKRMAFLKHLTTHDLYYFCKYVLRKMKLRERPNREMAERVMIRNRPGKQEWKLLVEPRGCFKTTIATQGFAVWELARNRDLSILIYSETDKQATEMYQACKEEMESNELLILLFGSFKSPRWNETRLFVTGRQQKGRRDPSLTHCGLDTSLNGIHPDRCLFDDLCSEENTQTVDQRDKSYSKLKVIVPLVNPDGIIQYTGTRWGDDDMIERLVKNHRPIFSDISIKSAEDVYEDTGRLYGADIGLTREVLDEKRGTMGTYFYSANYLNHPVPDSEQALNVSWLKDYDGEWPVDHEGNRISLGVYMGVDASWADRNANTGKDPTSMMVVGFSREGNVYLLDRFNKRIPPEEVVAETFRMVQKWSPLGVASEDVGTQKSINVDLDKEMVRRGIWFHLRRVKHQAQSKSNRIMGLSPLFERGQFFVNFEKHQDFVDQYRMFSPHHQITHDDMLDALEMAIATFRTVGGVTEEEADRMHEEQYSVYDPITGRA